MKYKEELQKLWNDLHGNSTQSTSHSTKFIAPKLSQTRGGRKTCIINFGELTKFINRDPSLVQQYFISELSAKCTIDSALQLVIKERLTQKNIENMLKRYIIKYVMCPDCREYNTELIKNKIKCLKCDTLHNVK